MADQDLSGGLPIQGASHLFQEGEEATQPEPGKEEAAPSEKAAETMTLEELEEALKGVKVPVQIAGEEVLVSPVEAIRYQQKNAGLEKTIQRQMQETRRLAEDARRTAESARVYQETAVQPGKTEEPADPDDPNVFVQQGARKFHEEIVQPKLDKLEQALINLANTLQPEIEESNQKTAKAHLGRNRVIGFTPEDFDSRRDAMIALFEQRAGRTVTARELAAIGPQHWVQAYLIVSRTPAPEKKPPPEPRPREVTVPPGGGGGGGGSRERAGSNSKEFQKAQETGDWSGYLKLRGVRPGTSG